MINFKKKKYLYNQQVIQFTPRQYIILNDFSHPISIWFHAKWNPSFRSLSENHPFFTCSIFIARIRGSVSRKESFIRKKCPRGLNKNIRRGYRGDIPPDKTKDFLVQKSSLYSSLKSRYKRSQEVWQANSLGAVSQISCPKSRSRRAPRKLT